jgi:hypothetical protein
MWSLVLDAVVEISRARAINDFSGAGSDFRAQNRMNFSNRLKFEIG